MGLSIATLRARLAVTRSAMLAEGGGALHIYGSAYPGMGSESAEPPLLIRALSAADLVVHATDPTMTLDVEANVALSGSPTWARFVDGAGVPVYDCTAGLPASGAVLIVTDGQTPAGSTMYPGGVVTISITFAEVA